MHQTQQLLLLLLRAALFEEKIDASKFVEANWKQIFNLSQKIGDSVSIGRSLYYMGDCFENFQKESAYYYYRESEKVFRLLKDDEKIAKALFNKAHLLFTSGNYIESEVEVIKALQKIKNTKNYELLYACYYL